MRSAISVEASTVIARPVEEVFAFASDQANEPTWHTDILEIRPAPGSDVGRGLGSRWIVMVSFMGRNEYEVEVTGFQPNRLVEITTKSGPLRPTTTYRLEPAGGGTRFRRHVDIPLYGMFRLMRPLIAPSAGRRNARFVENLKALLEDRTAS
ncbi:MAG: hypothetical protein GEU93_06040 [Propionibacteriales bacterium]|nr:hypothetical protein [Propionibacteriales bacterium]